MDLYSVGKHEFEVYENGGTVDVEGEGGLVGVKTSQGL